MARLGLLLLLISTCFTSATNSQAPISLAAHAISAVISEYFVSNVHVVDVVNFGERKGKSETTIQEILSLENCSMPKRISRIDRESLQPAKLKLERPSISFFDSPTDFKQIQDRIMFHPKSTSHPHLLYVHNSTIEDIEIVADLDKQQRYKTHKMIFLCNETLDSIDLVTIFFFSFPKKCEQNDFKVINRFTRQKMKWENPNFFLEKFKNFNKCPMDFKIEVERKIPRVYVLFAASLRIQIAPLLKGNAAFAYGVTPNLSRKFDMFVTEIQPLKIFIPPGEVYGDYEKMFLPFDNVIKLKPVEIQRVIFGSNTRSPLMNFVNILLNGSQHRTMMENAPRICLAVFLLWSLIFR
jgi:hypothetical protein